MAKADITRVSSLERVRAGERIGLARGTAAICVPLYAQHDLFVQCLQSLLAHTPPHVPILVADDATPDPASEQFLEELQRSAAVRHRLVYTRQERNVGFVANVNASFETLDPADVVIVNSDVIVGPEWFVRLRDAAYTDTNVATATALTNHGTILSVPDRNQPQPRLPLDTTVDDAAARVAQASLRLRPRIPTAIGHCTYIRRDALDLVGNFDETFSPGYGEEVDFSQRCIARGLSHVAADDVFVFHRGGASFRSSALRDDHEIIVNLRYPYYADAVRTVGSERTGPLARALSAARTALEPLSVTIDARFVGRTITGTQIQAVELIHALARTKQANLRLVVSANLEESERAELAAFDDVEVVTEDRFRDGYASLAPTDIVHRPSQVFGWSDLALIPSLGERFVLTHLDFIAYRNPVYAPSYEEWHEYQRVTRLALALADCVVFMSEHPARDAVTEDLVDASKTRVVHLGVDHRWSRNGNGVRPNRLPAAAEANFLLCIGTNFHHKNRVFALRLLDALQRRHRWSGWLVFAGPHASIGTSAGDEAEFLTTRPDVAARVADVKAVTEDEKSWLFRHAQGVVFASTYEGFGLVPFEAAQHGTPCFHAHQTSLRDILPDGTSTLVPWDADASADAVMRTLGDKTASDALVESILGASRELTWARAADEMLDVYRHVIRVPNRDIGRLADVDVPVSLHALTSAERERLADLPPDAYRALYALSTNRRTSPAFLRLVTALYATGFFLRFGRRHPPPDERA